MFNNKSRPIIQKIVTLYADDAENYMVLIFIEDKKPDSTHTIPFPKWFKFCDDTFEYYPVCLN